MKELPTVLVMYAASHFVVLVIQRVRWVGKAVV